MKIFSSVLVLIFVVGSAYYLVMNFSEPEPARNTAQNEDNSIASGTSMMRAENNMVVMMEQRPGNSVQGIVAIEAPGYLVIHDDVDGEPGVVLGVSDFLSKGEHSNVVVHLSSPSKDGDRYHAMLHFEKGGNTTFNASEDTPVPSELGGFISGWFDIADDAPVNVEVTI